ncbi:MAG: lytic polysaccharide monooxygenase [Bacilli bacterium]
MKNMLKWVSRTMPVVLCTALGLSLAPANAGAHGYVDISRAQLCRTGANVGCGLVQYEPQSLEALGNFPVGGPADGKIASANGAFAPLDEQTADRWTKVQMRGGANTFTWKLTANHATREWKYYITKKGWDPNKPFGRADLELIAQIADGGRPPTTVQHTVNVPTDRNGYYLILAVWEIADTPNAFYNVIDVNLNNGDVTPDTLAPSVPAELRATAVTSSSVSLAWNASNDNVGVVGYDVFRNGVKVGASATPTFTDTNLVANTNYQYAVRAYDAAGNTSATGSVLSVQTSTIVTPVYEPWSATKVYLGGNRVSYNGLVYEARWWTLGEQPGRADVWRLIP